MHTDSTGYGAFQIEAEGAERLVVAYNLMTGGANGGNSKGSHGTAVFTGVRSWAAVGDHVDDRPLLEQWRYPAGSAYVPTLGALWLLSTYALEHVRAAVW